jgi:hypothetical protein
MRRPVHLICMQGLLARNCSVGCVYIGSSYICREVDGWLEFLYGHPRVGMGIGGRVWFWWVQVVSLGPQACDLGEEVRRFL